MERQLGLFKGPRQRGTSARPRTSEFALHCKIADDLRLWCHPLWRYTHLPMGEKRDPATAMRLKRMGVTKGWPDFIFVQQITGWVVWLELKRPGGRLSEEQEALANFLAECEGHQHIVCNDYQMAVDLLGDLGILRVRVHA